MTPLEKLEAQFSPRKRHGAITVAVNFTIINVDPSTGSIEYTREHWVYNASGLLEHKVYHTWGAIYDSYGAGEWYVDPSSISEESISRMLGVLLFTSPGENAIYRRIDKNDTIIFIINSTIHNLTIELYKNGLLKEYRGYIDYSKSLAPYGINICGEDEVFYVEGKLANTNYGKEAQASFLSIFIASIGLIAVVIVVILIKLEVIEIRKK